jgi:hypothetical protein
MRAAVQHVRGLDFFAMADGLGKKINLPAHPCRAWRGDMQGSDPYCFTCQR